MSGGFRCDSLNQLTSCLDALVPMNDICLSKSVFGWDTLTSDSKVSVLFGEEEPECPPDDWKPAECPLNQVVFSDKRAKNQLLTSIIYQTLRPVYEEIDGTGEYSMHPLDLPHIEILFLDNSSDFCFETLKDMIFEDLLTIFKENKAVQKIEILEFTYTILDKITVQESFNLKELMFNLKKASVHIKRNPAVRLVVVDALNTFFVSDFSKFNNMFNSTDPPKRSTKSHGLLEYLVAKEVAKISHGFRVKVLFTTVEYFSKKGIRVENEKVCIEEQIYKQMNYQASDQFDMGISVLYLVNPSLHSVACVQFLKSIGSEEIIEPNSEIDHLIVINKTNNGMEYNMRAITIEKGLMTLSVAKQVEVRGGFGRGYFSDEDDWKKGG